MKTSQILMSGAVFLLALSQYAFGAPQAYRYTANYSTTPTNATESDTTATATGEWTYQDEKPTDRAISDRIRRLIHRDDRFSKLSVQIITKDGVVKLQGSVASAKQKNDIDQQVKRVDGVKSVDNQLIVQESSPQR